MSTIYIAKLNKEVKRGIANHRYSLEEVEHVKANIGETINMRKKTFRFVIIGISVVVIALSILTLIQTDFNEAAIFSVLLMIPISVIIIVFAWFISAGHLKNQYNRAVKKGYPEHIDKLRL
ncbi:MAG: hypothetical protein E7212_05085 [Clostridium sartagoforme]|nr:hypothetical protein [Clostridium sartagoforme]